VRRDVSVIVATCRGGATVAGCLESLARQTLPPDRFEIVAVQNGEPDDTALVLDRFAAAHPAVALRRVETRAAGLALARNLGLDVARGRYVTFVDDDDWVSPEYLEVLLANSAPSVAGLAQLAEVHPGSARATLDTAQTRWQLAQRGDTVPAHQLPSALGIAVLKMIDTALARAIRFDETIVVSEDVDFWARVHAATLLEFRVCPVEAHAVYYRRVRPGSLGRQTPSFTFSVEQRLEIIERLERVRLSSGLAEVAQATRQLERGQASTTNRFLLASPGDYRRTLAAYRRRAPADLEQPMRAGAARNLAVLYAAVPFANTSANVAARRIRDAGLLTDVVSSDMSEICGLDPSLEEVWADFVDQRVQVASKPTYAWWPGILDFCRRGMAQIEQWEAAKGDYHTMYSRAVWLHANVLAAWHKARRPGVRWTAEFSDPILYNLAGEQRVGSGLFDPRVRDELTAAVRAAGFEPGEDTNSYWWGEMLAYALADEIVFTNEQQRSYMLGYVADRALAERALAVSRVEPHPVPDASLYRRVRPSYTLAPDRVNIGYFGGFYATRRMSEVLVALRDLPAAVSSRLRLHVFTAEPDALADAARPLIDAGAVVVNGAVSYLECLNLTTRMDVLLINDTDTSGTHPINPYLPSKLADYTGSGTPIWGVVEAGSVLSSRNLTYRSRLGSAADAATVLTALAAREPVSDGD
jgi:hypothetical protein